MRKIVSSFIFLIVANALRIQAQASFPTSLPTNIDGISAFYRMSRLNGASGWRPEPTTCPEAATGLPMCGWGFELVYELTGKEEQQPAATSTTGWVDAAAVPKKKSRWEVELAVGYDFLNVHAKTRGDARYEMFGSIQTLPSISLYFSHDLSKRTAYYFGIGTGFVVLKNLRIYDLHPDDEKKGTVFTVTGDTWGFTPSVGGIYTIRDNDSESLGVALFVEGAYEFRNFTSLAYTLPANVSSLPKQLQPSLHSSGFVANFGVEMKLRKKQQGKS